MNNQNKTKINQLLQKWPNGTVATTQWLGKNGISLNLITAYEKSGWVERIGSGAVIRSGDTLKWPGALYALQAQLGLFVHPGAKTALALLGAAHTIPLGRLPVFLFKNRKDRMPAWFKRNNWDAQIEVVETSMFQKNPEVGMSVLSQGDFTIKVSSRERAMFEVLYLLSGNGPWEEVKSLMEGLATLRPNVVQQLLAACSSIKVKRLFMVLAEESEHAWLQKLDVSNINFGSGKRLFAQNGYLHPRHLITVPYSWKHQTEGGVGI
jgi:hypothetical protein